MIVIEPNQLREKLIPQTIQLRGIDIETQLLIIKSSPVLEKVVRELGLSSAEEGTPGFRRAVNNLKGSLNAEFLGDSLMVEITAIHTDPKLPRDIANTVAQAYIEHDRDSRLEAGREALSWLTEQIADIQTRLNNAEKAFQAFKQKEGIVSLDIKQEEDALELSQLRSNHVRVRLDRMKLEAIIRRLDKEPDAVTKIPVDILTTQSLQALNSQLVGLQAQLAEKAKIFKDNFPAIIKLKDEIELTNKNIIKDLQKQFDALKSQEAILQSSYDAKMNQILNLGGKEVEYSTLDRDVKAYKGLYEALITKVQQLSLVDDSDLSNIRIVEKAEIPIGQKERNIGEMKRQIAFGTVLGLALGFLT